MTDGRKQYLSAWIIAAFFATIIGFFATLASLAAENYFVAVLMGILTLGSGSILVQNHRKYKREDEVAYQARKRERERRQTQSISNFSYNETATNSNVVTDNSFLAAAIYADQTNMFGNQNETTSNDIGRTNDEDDSCRTVGNTIDSGADGGTSGSSETSYSSGETSNSDMGGGTCDTGGSDSSSY